MRDTATINDWTTLKNITSAATPEQLRSERLFACEGCSWIGPASRAVHRNGCLACPTCGRFAYPKKS